MMESTKREPSPTGIFCSGFGELCNYSPSSVVSRDTSPQNCPSMTHCSPPKALMVGLGVSTKLYRHNTLKCKQLDIEFCS